MRSNKVIVDYYVDNVLKDYEIDIIKMNYLLEDTSKISLSEFIYKDRDFKKWRKSNKNILKNKED